MSTNLQRSIRLVLALLTLLSMFSAQAMSIDWSGNYRLEWVNIDKTTLDTPSLSKSYLLNSLQLSPKIIAADGVNIIGKFNIFHNSNYPNSQIGQVWGAGQTLAAPAPPNTVGGASLAVSAAERV